MSTTGQHASGDIDRRALLGTELHRFRVAVERGRLRLFAKAIGETDPIHSDEEAARAAGYPDIVAPPTFLYCLSEEVPNPQAVFTLLGLDPGKALHAEQEITLERPVCAGEELDCVSRLADYFEKKDGRLKFAVTVSDFTDADGAIVGTLRTIALVREDD